MSPSPKEAPETGFFRRPTRPGATDHMGLTSKDVRRMRFTDAEWRLWFRTLCALKAFAT